MIGDNRILSTKYLVKAIREGRKNGERFCFILGAGASVSSGIPTGAELEYRWMEDMAAELGMEEVSRDAKALREKDQLDHDFAEIKNAWEEAKKAKRKALASEYYFDIYTLRFRPNYRNGYHYLENLMEDANPSFGYHPLALLLADEGGSNLVITTNFDSLVEDSLFLYTNKKPLVINHELLAEFAGDLNIRRPVIAKLHRGLFFDPLNRAEETKELHGRWKEVLEKVFQNYTPIVIGYGGGDSSLMGVLQEESIKMKNGIYWCYMEKYGLPDEKIQEIVKNKEGYLVRTAGFDAVMLAVGNALFPNEIDPAGAERHLSGKINKQIIAYGEEYRQLVKEEKEHESEAEEGINASEKEFEQDIEEFKIRVNETESERENQNRMSGWDYVRQGNRYYDEGEYERAVESYTKSLDIQDMAEAYYNRGCAYSKLKENEKAVQDYSSAIELDPDYAYAYYNRGNEYFRVKEFGKAVLDYNKTIELNPGYAEAYYNLGSAHYELGESEKAVQNYSKAIELDPDDENGYNNRGNAYSQLRENEKAVSDYKKAVELNPNYVKAYYNLGSFFKNNGDLAKAEEYFTQAIERDSGYKSAYQKRAEVYRALGQDEKAAADEETASKLES